MLRAVEQMKTTRYISNIETINNSCIEFFSERKYFTIYYLKCVYALLFTIVSKQLQDELY